MPKEIEADIIPDNMDEEDLIDNMSSRNIFDSEPDEIQEETEETEEVEETEEPEETEEVEETEEPEETEETDDNVEEEEEDEEPDFDGELIKEEKGNPLRKQLQEKGREAKELAAAKVELELELDKYKQEVEQLKAQLENSTVASVDIHNHPDIVSTRNAIFKKRDMFMARHLNGNQDFGQAFPSLIESYAEAEDANSPEEISQKLTEIRKTVFDQFGDKSKYDEYELEDGQIPNDATVEKVMDFLESQVPEFKAMYQKAQDLQSRVKNNTLAKGVEEYKAAEKEVSSVLEPVGDLPDEFIEENPHKPEVIIAKLIKESPEAKKRSDAAKKFVLEAFNGVKPLTQEEIDKIKANYTGTGDPIKDFEKTRNKKAAERRSELMKKAYIGLMLLSDFEKMHKGYSEYSSERSKTAKEEDALDGLSKRGKDSLPKKEEPRPKDTKPAYKSLLDDMGR